MSPDPQPPFLGPPVHEKCVKSDSCFHLFQEKKSTAPVTVTPQPAPPPPPLPASTQSPAKNSPVSTKREVYRQKVRGGRNNVYTMTYTCYFIQIIHSAVSCNVYYYQSSSSSPPVCCCIGRCLVEGSTAFSSRWINPESASCLKKKKYIIRRPLYT